MDRFVAAVRRLFKKKENGEGSTANDVQKVARKPHPYDDVTVDDNGTNVEGDQPNEFQKAPQRAPRSYEEVDLPVNTGGKVEIR